MNTEVFLCLLLLAVVGNCQERVKLTRCELVELLRANGFASTSMRTWVCIVEAESNRDTSLKVSKPNGTFGWGLFQLANPTWCTPGAAGGTCKAKCEDFLTNDITKAAACASTAYKQSGFNAWPTFTTSCQKDLPDITACLLLRRVIERKVEPNELEV